jgi:hypothetical protein
MPGSGKKKFFQPSVAFWTNSSRLSRRQENRAPLEQKQQEKISGNAPIVA